MKFKFPPIKFKKVLKYIAFLILSVLVICEIALRIFYSEQLKTRAWPPIHKPDSLYTTYIPNSEGLLISPGVNHFIKINSLGFLGKEFNKQKADSIFRIMVVGNSEASGIHMNSDNTFCVQLQNLFSLYGFNVEVINCAHNGPHKDIQNLRFVKNELIKYHPDLILFESKPEGSYEECKYVLEYYKGYIFEYDLNDKKSRDICIQRVNEINKAWYATMFYDASYIVRAICKNYIDKSNLSWFTTSMLARNDPFEINLYTYITKETKVSTPTYKYTYEKTIEIIKDLKVSLDSINCNFTLFTYGNYLDAIQKIYDENNIDCIELKLGERFGALPINSNLEGHSNQIGHTLITERMFGQLILNNNIPKEFYPKKYK